MTFSHTQKKQKQQANRNEILCNRILARFVNRNMEVSCIQIRIVYTFNAVCPVESQLQTTDRQTDRQTDRETDRQTDRQTDK